MSDTWICMGSALFGALYAGFMGSVVYAVATYNNEKAVRFGLLTALVAFIIFFIAASIVLRSN